MNVGAPKKGTWKWHLREEPRAINRLVSADFETMPEFANNTEVKAQQASEIALRIGCLRRLRLDGGEMSRQSSPEEEEKNESSSSLVVERLKHSK
ncbi:hypothetical protein AKJ16_DCAP12071 [Drosera capensis]